ncbi:MAG: ABC transporter permease [Bacteroidota bacterium]|nr:ABC transporter permease [Bacteroidota bacterium]MDP4190449.1 ABC transporter permease [Bacteroidota bacterium]MDP4194177.1 ABC transporter permease [Bacteroidota bacterium]
MVKVKFNYTIGNISLRQLTYRKRQTILTISGISLGVMVLISAISLMDGLLQSFIDKIVNIAPHIVISGEKIKTTVKDTLYQASGKTYINFIKNVERKDEEIIKNYSRVIYLIQKEKTVNVIAPVVSVNLIAKFGTLSQPLELLGISPELHDKIVKFSDNMISGKFSELERTPDGLIIGTTSASDLSVKMGDKLQIVSNSGGVVTVRIIGVFSTGINDIDNNAYVNLRLAQNLAGYSSDELTNLYLRVTDLSKDAAVARSIEKMINYHAKTWEETAASVISLYKMISVMVYFLVFFVILVAGFGVANVLITNVLEKYRDIAILKSLGFQRNEITWIYLIQGLFVAIIGAVLGCLLALVMIKVLGTIKITPSKTGSIRSDRLQMGMSIWYFIFASSFAIIISLVASIGPSRGASKLNPVEILRGER